MKIFTIHFMRDENSLLGYNVYECGKLVTFTNASFDVMVLCVPVQL